MKLPKIKKIKYPNLRHAFGQLPRSIKLGDIAKGLGVTRQAMHMWIKENRMPDSEYSGRTNYAAKIEALSEGKIKVSDLLWFKPPHQEIKK